MGRSVSFSRVQWRVTRSGYLPAVIVCLTMAIAALSLIVLFSDDAYEGALWCNPTQTMIAIRAKRHVDILECGESEVNARRTRRIVAAGDRVISMAVSDNGLLGIGARDGWITIVNTANASGRRVERRVSPFLVEIAHCHGRFVALHEPGWVTTWNPDGSVDRYNLLSEGDRLAGWSMSPDGALIVIQSSQNNRIVVFETLKFTVVCQVSGVDVSWFRFVEESAIAIRLFDGASELMTIDPTKAECVSSREIAQLRSSEQPPKKVMAQGTRLLVLTDGRLTEYIEAELDGGTIAQGIVDFLVRRESERVLCVSPRGKVFSATKGASGRRGN